MPAFFWWGSFSFPHHDCVKLHFQTIFRITKLFPVYTDWILKLKNFGSFVEFWKLPVMHMNYSAQLWEKYSITVTKVKKKKIPLNGGRLSSSADILNIQVSVMIPCCPLVSNILTCNTKSNASSYHWNYPAAESPDYGKHETDCLKKQMKKDEFRL